MITEPNYTDAQVQSIIDRVTRENSADGMDGDSWDRLLVRAALSERQAAMQGQGGEVRGDEDTPITLADMDDLINVWTGNIAANGSLQSTAAHELKALVRRLQVTRPMQSVSNEAWKEPTGFSVSGIRDEANNWTRRETGKEMLLNYAACLEHFAAIAQEKQS